MVVLQNPFCATAMLLFGTPYIGAMSCTPDIVKHHPIALPMSWPGTYASIRAKSQVVQMQLGQTQAASPHEQVFCHASMHETVLSL